MEVVEKSREFQLFLKTSESPCLIVHVVLKQKRKEKLEKKAF